ncbi:TPM domain-containing protein [Winogradskyella sp. PE311]|uniref:TPM domain-containing protein n=1 Tax=Winogradskyella sp. PE311 TaxID=3366943 RepID=UPI00397FB6D0
MRIHFPLLVVICVICFLNCKDKPPETVAIPTYIPKNSAQSVVYDASKIFTIEEKKALTNKIMAYEKETTNEIGVLTIDSAPFDMHILDFGTEVSNAWGIGKKDKNNGLLITFAKKDKSIAIAVGLGTEAIISDANCKIIIDSVMIPKFKENRFYEGIDRAIDSLIVLWD